MTFEEWIKMIRDKASAVGINLNKIDIGYIEVTDPHKSEVSINNGELIID